MNTINKKNVTWNPMQELRSSIRIAAQSLWNVCAASCVYHYYRGREMMKLESNATISPQSNMTNNKDHTSLGTPMEWRRTVFRKKTLMEDWPANWKCSRNPPKKWCWDQIVPDVGPFHLISWCEIVAATQNRKQWIAIRPDVSWEARTGSETMPYHR